MASTSSESRHDIYLRELNNLPNNLPTSSIDIADLHETECQCNIKGAL